MANDPAVQVIAVVLEGIRDGRRYADSLALARGARKPVVVLKVGRSEYGVRAVQSHTGAVAGSAEVNRAIHAQFGAIEVDDLNELVGVTRLLATGGRCSRDGLAIFTFSGGAAALAADMAGSRGFELAVLGTGTTDALKALLPSFAAISNPVDLTAEVLTNQGLVESALRALLEDPDVKTVLVPVPADYGTITTHVGRAIVEVSKTSAKPILVAWMSRQLGEGHDILNRAGCETYASLGEALAVMDKAAVSRAPVSGGAAAHAATHETPPDDGPNLQAIGEVAAKAMLKQAGLPIPEGALARDATQAGELAALIGFPLAMKIASADIAHKTEVSGVRLNITSTEEAGRVFDELMQGVAALRPGAVLDGVLLERMFGAGGREMLVGLHTDAVFGRILTLGIGGIHVELYKDVVHRLLPINEDDARQMIDALKARAYLAPFRGMPAADIDALVRVLVQISAFAAANIEIHEADFNPVWLGPQGEGAALLDALLFTPRTS